MVALALTPLRRLCLCVVALLLLAPGLGADEARAQFVSMDRMRDASLIGARLDLTRHDNDASLYVRNEIYAQLVSQLMGFYGHVALNHWLSTDDGAPGSPTHGETRSSLGNVEIGGFLTRRNAGNNVVLRVGIVLPTARDEDGIGRFTMARNAWGRLTDLLTAVPEVTALRLSASPYVRGGAVFFRADAGLDLVLPSGGTLELRPRGNLGVGWDTGLLIFTGEVVNAMRIEEFPGPLFLHALTFSAQHGILKAALTAGLREAYNPVVFSIGVESGF